MSKSYGKRRGCERKIAYDTKAEAEAHLHAAGMKVYRCSFANHWHTSSGGRNEPLKGANLDELGNNARQAAMRKGQWGRIRKWKNGRK